MGRFDTRFRFEILGKASTPSKPRKRPLDHPATRRNDEALGGVGTFYNLELHLSQDLHHILLADRGNAVVAAPTVWPDTQYITSAQICRYQVELELEFAVSPTADHRRLEESIP